MLGVGLRVSVALRTHVSWIRTTGPSGSARNTEEERVADGVSDSVVLATHEAAANAIEHAQPGNEVTVRGVRAQEKLIQGQYEGSVPGGPGFFSASYRVSES
jgi:anti-sigma regulatory factor (Ser/Thr protein kinase)